MPENAREQKGREENGRRGVDNRPASDDNDPGNALNA